MSFGGLVARAFHAVRFEAAAFLGLGSLSTLSQVPANIANTTMWRRPQRRPGRGSA